MSKYLHPVSTVKHVVDIQGGLVIATQANNDLVLGVSSPALGNVAEVVNGSHVRSIFLNVQVAGSSTAALSNVYMILYGNPGSNIAAGQIPDANQVGSNDFKKQVFHQEMIMTEKNTTAFPRTLFRGVLKIPRKFQRIGIADKISLQLFAPGTTYDFCFQCIYKEIR